MEEQIKQLAENLKKNGLAASMSEAIEKAKSILNIKSQKNYISQENQTIKKTPEQNIENKRPMLNVGIDIKNQNTPLKELLKAINITPEQVETQGQEKVEDIKEETNEIKKDIKEAQENPEKIDQVKEEINKITETKEAFQKKKPKEDRFKEEKKVDLTKIFGKK